MAEKLRVNMAKTFSAIRLRKSTAQKYTFKKIIQLAVLSRTRFTFRNDVISEKADIISGQSHELQKALIITFQLLNVWAVVSCLCHDKRL